MKSKREKKIKKKSEEGFEKSWIKIDEPKDGKVMYRLGKPGEVELVKLRKGLSKLILESIKVRVPKCVEEVLDQLVDRVFDGDELITINWPLIMNANVLLTMWKTKKIERR